MNNTPKKNLLKRSFDHESDSESSEPLRKKSVWYRPNRETNKPPPAPRKKKSGKPSVLQRKEHNRLAEDEKMRDLCDVISDISLESDDMEITLGVNSNSVFPTTLEELIAEWDSKLTLNARF